MWLVFLVEFLVVVGISILWANAISNTRTEDFEKWKAENNIEWP